MLNKITFVLGIVAFILTSLQVWGFLPRNIPYALCILMIMEFMWGIKTIRENKNNANKYGKTLKDYRDIILKTCEDFSIPCIDLYKESGIYVFNSVFKSTYIPDGLHPNEKGHKKIANKVIGEVKKYISI